VALGPVARGIGADRPELRAALAATQMTGLAVTRYVIRLEPVASAPAEALVSAVGPTVERYLLGPL
jgi:hypothetical protein